MSRKGGAKGSCAAQPAVQGCTVKSERAIAIACTRKLQNLLECGRVDYSVQKHANGASSLHFTTYPRASALIRGAECPVLQLDEIRWLHLAIDLDFVARNQWRLKHISIDILEGEATHLGKKSLLRAEWMMHGSCKSDGHAQPHWHAIGAAGIEPREDFEDYLAEGPGFDEFLAGESTRKVSAAFKHFHYAMVTGWHRNPQDGHCHVLESEESAIAWILGCVGYIQHQLAHVSRKDGKATLATG